MSRRLLPGGTASGAGGIEYCVQLAQVPAQPMCFIRRRKRDTRGFRPWRAMNVSGGTPSQRNRNKACWQLIFRRAARFLIVEGLTG